MREGAIDPADEAAGAEPGADDLAPHGLKWTVAEASLEADGVSSRKASVKWRDYDLGDKRTPIDYFRHFYPVRHVPEMLEATNAVLAEKEKSPLTEQEFFVYVGLLLLMTFYPTFPVAVLFGVAGGVFSTRKFLALPKMQEYMSFYRFKLLGDNLTFATTPPADERARCAFWKVQPLVNAFNKNRKDGFVASFKVVADESMFEWQGRDQRHGEAGCPHVTKIIRKPKSVGMEVKNLACVQTGIILVLEIMAGKDEMGEREFAAALGAGTALLLRLTASLKASGRIVIADSAFASVKSAVRLRKDNGLFFLGHVKTATRQFPKKYFCEVAMEARGDYVTLTSESEGVPLRAVGWNEGKRDKKTGQIIRKQFIGTCATSVAGRSHRKRRWEVNDDGSTTKYYFDVKRPNLVEAYYNGAQMIDVHNHLRQGSLRLEARKTKRWQIRFFNCWLGICTVDAYLAYKRFCPGKDTVSQDDFVLDVIGELLDNTFGVAGGRVLRARPADDEPASSRVRRMHDMRQLMDTEHFTAKRAAHEENGRPTRSATLRCRICHTECCMYCLTCSPNPAKAKGIFAVCGPMTGRDCFLKHQQMSSQACAGAAGGSGGSGGNGSGGSGGR